jgi:CheY-like chemotaxis protein
VFVESTDHAYSQVKGVHPNLVILCVGVNDRDGLQVLSMLKLDADTRRIPVLTYMTEADDDEPDEPLAEFSDAEMFTPKTALRLH